MAHKKEMQKFREAWSQVFMKQSMEERMLMQRLNRLRD